MNAPPWMTVLVTIAFIWLLYMLLRPGAKKRYDEHGKIPFADEDQEPGKGAGEGSGSDESTDSADDNASDDNQNNRSGQ